MNESPERDERHQARMLRKKAVMDERIASAPNECGLLLVLTGNGKGKSSSAFGMLARAMGHGMQCGVVQFIKGRNSTGEEIFFHRFPEQVRYHVMGEGFTWETQDRQRDIAASEAAWEESREMLRDPAVKAEFERRLREDTAFAQSPAARLEFFYRRHPSWDERYQLYPVLRVDAAP